MMVPEMLMMVPELSKLPPELLMMVPPSLLMMPSELLMMVPPLCTLTVTPESMVSVTPELTVHVSPLAIILSVVIVVSVANVIDAAWACMSYMAENESKTAIAIIVLGISLLIISLPLHDLPSFKRFNNSILTKKFPSKDMSKKK